MSTDSYMDIESRLRKLVHDSSIYSIAASLSSLLGLVALLIFTRVFSPSAYGRYSTSVAVVAIVSTLLFGWTEQAVVRFAAEVETHELVRNVLFVLALITGGFVLASAIGYLLFEDDLGAFRLFYLPVVALVVAQGLFQPLLMFFRGTLESRSVATYRLISSVARLLVSLALALLVLGSIVGWIWGTAVAILGTVVLAFLSTDELRVMPRVDRDVLGRLLGYGIPMIGFIIGEPFLTQVDRILLEVLRDSTAVGVYSSNYTLINQALRLAYFPVLRAMQPIVVNVWNGSNEAEASEVIADFTRYYLLLGVPVLVLGAGIGRPMSALLLEGGYEQGYTIIPFVAAGVFLWGLADAGQRGLELKEATLTLSIGVLIAIGLNVALNVPLITYFGYMGAAFATLLSSAVYVLFVKYVSGRYIGWRFPEGTVRNTTLGGIVMALPIAAVYLSGSYSSVLAVAATVLAAPIYLAVVYALGEFRQEELDAVAGLYGAVTRLRS
jgi:O-antigen/teichoic acid export membrane protein